MGGFGNSEAARTGRPPYYGTGIAAGIDGRAARRAPGISAACSTRSGVDNRTVLAYFNASVTVIEDMGVADASSIRVLFILFVAVCKLLAAYNAVAGNDGLRGSKNRDDQLPFLNQYVSAVVAFNHHAVGTGAIPGKQRTGVVIGPRDIAMRAGAPGIVYSRRSIDRIGAGTSITYRRWPGNGDRCLPSGQQAKEHETQDSEELLHVQFFHGI